MIDLNYLILNWDLSPRRFHKIGICEGCWSKMIQTWSLYFYSIASSFVGSLFLTCTILAQVLSISTSFWKNICSLNLNFLIYKIIFKLINIIVNYFYFLNYFLFNSFVRVNKLYTLIKCNYICGLTSLGLVCILQLRP